MTGELRAALRRNFAVNVLDSGFFGFAMGAASFVAVIPLFVSQLTDSALLIALIPAIHTLGWQLPQLLTVQRVSRMQRYLPFTLQMTLNERLPYIGLTLVALFLPRLDTNVALVLTYLLLIWQGLGGGFTATAWQTMIAKIIPAHRLGFFFGTQNAAISLLGAIAAAVSGWFIANLVQPYNFAAAFGSAVVALVISWFCLAATYEPPHETEAQSQESALVFLRSLPRLLRNDPNFVWYVVCRWVVQVGFIGSAFYSVYAVNERGVSAVVIGLYTSLMLITQMVLSPVAGWLGDRWSHRGTMAIGTVALSLSALLAWWAPSAQWFATVFLLLGVAQVVYWVSGNAILLEFSPSEKERPIYIGLANTPIAPAAILAPLIGGWVADRTGYQTAFLASALGAAITALLLFLVVRDPRRMRREAARPLVLVEDHAPHYVEPAVKP